MTDRSSRAEAPGLALVQEFINSLDYPSGPDQLGTPDAAGAWLRARGTPVRWLTAQAHARLLDARERLRDLLEAHTGENVDGSVLVRIRELFTAAPLLPDISPEGARLVAPVDGVDGFLARLAVVMVEATLEGTWPRLKVCKADSCRFAFFDQSKNGRRAWCSMQVCGSRQKARAYRERKRGEAAIS